MKDESEIFYYARLKGSTQRMMGTCQKDTEVDLKRVLTGQNGLFEQQNNVCNCYDSMHPY